MSKTSTERIYEIIRSPLISEKSTFISQFNYYVFKVSPNSNKKEIKNAVENIFKVEVKSVNTLNQKLSLLFYDLLIWFDLIEKI